MSWRDKVVVITGGAVGIGAATAKIFAADGAAIVIMDRDEPQSGLLDELQAAGGRAAFVRGDVTKEDDIEEVRRKAVDLFGRIDVLVNNAGIMRRHAARDWTIPEIRQVLDINLLSQFMTTQIMMNDLASHGGGSIVNIASMGATIPLVYSPAYSASKAGVLAFTRSSAEALADQKIRVNAILPGFVDTPMTIDAPSRGSMPLMEARDIARAIAFVAADESLTGKLFAVQFNGNGAPTLDRLNDTVEFDTVAAFNLA